MERGKIYKKGLLVDYIYYPGTKQHVFTWEKGRETIKECDLNNYLDSIGYIHTDTIEVLSNLKNEIWKKIADNYSISNKGRVRNDKKNRLIVPFKHNRKVVFSIYENGKIKQLGLAYAVARAFYGDIKKVIRIDGNCFNNCIENLKIYV